MKIKRGIPFIEISAKDNEEFGYKLGKKLKKEIQYRLEKNKKLYHEASAWKKPFSHFVEESKKYLVPLEKNFPELLKEAKAIARGAEVPFEELFVIMCENEVVDFTILHCTSVAVRTKDNEILVGHNEDWFQEYTKWGLFLVKGKIGKNRFLATGFIGNLAGSSVGFNEAGVVHTDNSLMSARFTIGVPRSFHLRALLDAKDPKDALRILNKTGSAVSNTMMAWSDRKLFDIEELWTKHRVFTNDEFLVHTNHPILKKYQTKKNSPAESRKRYKRAVEILSNEKELTIESIKKVLRDHKAKICEHRRKKDKYVMSAPTIASFIMNPRDKWIMVCCGQPCVNPYKKYYL